jgi:hypothetical protein
VLWVSTVIFYWSVGIDREKHGLPTYLCFVSFIEIAILNILTEDSFLFHGFQSPILLKLLKIRPTFLSRILTNDTSIAGVSLGPFADYKSRLFSGSAAELFDFANLDSEVSKRYENSLRVALKYGVRVSFIGSIDDQLVSLEVSKPPALTVGVFTNGSKSAIFSPINHPYIYRAVFVDGRVHAPDL